MKDLYLKTCVKAHGLRDLFASESGQDLIEYALVVALIALAATAGMSGIAGQINAGFTSIGTKMQTYTS